MKNQLFWKRKKIAGILMISALMIILCLIQIARPKREYIFEGECLFQEGVPVEDYPVYKDIQLLPGVYRVELDCLCTTDIQDLCYARDDTVFPGGY